MNNRVIEEYKQLLLQNKAWVEQKTLEDADFFKKLSKIQSPKFLWIGCSDSRVPANEITGTKPGEVFVHRNIANMVVNTDMNLLSVLDYAVNVLTVEHVIVCGHYGCGGVRAAMGQQQYGLIDNWIRDIKDVYRTHYEELEAIADLTARENRLVELNVIEQVYDLSKTSIIQSAWKKRGGPYIHGWVYNLETGLINDLNVTYHSNSELPAFYRLMID
ncbi:MAG: Carbonic anhydrase, beta class [Cytophagales bacterium]|jgi:carbonic anhydrase|nr:carbonate dehydratase [Bacteroidota bacterium]MBS1980938.1 carbonate dehydratase [Bacteroidota bacterium]WHZ08292.1 MAG: Carbonic anhydrase, beta class [Cytophagales bacterium]